MAALSEWELLLQRKGYCSKIGKIHKIIKKIIVTWEKAALSEWKLLLQRKGCCSNIGKIHKITISSEWIRKSRPYPTPLLIMPCSCTRRRLK